jgi:hypothetical protein
MTVASWAIAEAPALSVAWTDSAALGSYQWEALGMFDRREREIDVELGPAQVMWARPLNAGDLPDGGVLKP